MALIQNIKSHELRWSEVLEKNRMHFLLHGRAPPQQSMLSNPTFFTCESGEERRDGFEGYIHEG